MRVLFSTTAGSGHFGPLVPYARACLDAGHQVKVAAPASFAPAVSKAGFDHAPFADVPAPIMGSVFGRLPELSLEEANVTVLVEIFGRLDAQAALPGLTEIVARWRPDVVVREPGEFGSAVVAERAGVPQAQVAIGMGAMGGYALSILEAALAELSVQAGLPEGRAFELVSTMPTFTSVPAALDALDQNDLSPSVGVAGRGPVSRFRDASLTAGPGSLPPPWGDERLPLIYVTFGSVTATLEPFASIFSATIAALADSSVRVLMTTGDGIDPRSLPSFDNAHVEQWWPQSDVMAHAAAVVGHGGFGTTMTALAAGVPQVVVPLFALDQTINAQRVAAVGAGIHLSGGPSAADALAAAVDRVLTEATFRNAAQSIAAAMGELPDVATAVPQLEAFAKV